MTAAPGADVTIVVSCFEQADYIREAIASAQQQTSPCRIIVVDDGSTDGSADAAESLGVETIRLPHRGALETFRAGVALVETSFYCLLNADDVMDPRYVELTLQAAADPSIGFVYTGTRLFGAEERIVHVPDFDLTSLRWGNYVHAASLTRKAAYDSVGGFDERFADHHEDWALWIAIACKGWRGVAVDLPLLGYRRFETDGRNPGAPGDVERARWKLFRRHPRLYGITGTPRLLASSARMAITGR